MRSEALVMGSSQEAPVVKVSRCSCELVKCRLKVVIVVWMMTYLESSGNIPYMQGTQMAADGGWARGWYGLEVQPLCFGGWEVEVLYTAGTSETYAGS